MEPQQASGVQLNGLRVWHVSATVGYRVYVLSMEQSCNK